MNGLKWLEMVQNDLKLLKMVWNGFVVFFSGTVEWVDLLVLHLLVKTQNITAQKSAKLHGYCPTSFLNIGVVCIANGEWHKAIISLKEIPAVSVLEENPVVSMNSTTLQNACLLCCF